MPNAAIVNTPSQAYPSDGYSHGQITVSSTAVTLSSSETIPAKASHVLVQFNDATARVTFDGTTPTASLGFRYVTGSSAYWPRKMWLAAKAIREDATDVVVEVQALNYLL